MDEMLNVQIATENSENIPEEIPENTFLDEPEYIIKKKFCFASIPAIIATGVAFLLSAMMVFTAVVYIIDGFDYGWTNLVNAVFYIVQFVGMALLCVFAFAKLNKPFACISPFVMAFSNFALLVVNVFNVHNLEEFEAIFYSEDNFGRYDYYSYTDYMTIRICWWAFMATLILSFVAFGVYMILASGKNAGNGVKKLWFITVILSALSVVMYIAYTVVSFALYYVGAYTEIWEAVLISLMTLLLDLAVCIPAFVALAFFCKWISNPYKKVLKKVEEPEIPSIEETAEMLAEEEEAEGDTEETAEEEQKPAEPIVARSAPVAPPKPVEPKPHPVAPPPVMNQAPVRPVMPPPAMRQPPVRPVAPPPVNVFVPSNQETTMAQKNNIELIKQYKELLDMGAITQEEYDEKKKELLANN